MNESDDVRDAMLRFYDRLNASDVDAFEDVVSSLPEALTIGTAPGEWITERARLRYGFEIEGVSMKDGDPTGYEEGSLGWVVDEPTMHFPDGSSIRTRLTAVMHKEEGAWRLLHMHVSVGVPDEEVVELQRRWSTMAA